MKRRQFLTSAARSGAFVSATTLATARAAGANERVRVGLIGCGGRGRFVVQHMRRVPQVELAAVCDVYEPNLARAQSSADKGCTAYSDFRQLLDQPQVEAVVVATPDHWHAIVTVMACAAGKDVYVEKPLAHNIREGQAMVEAAREHHRIVQVGTQQRSAAHFTEMRQIVESGQLGKVHFVRIWNYRNVFPRGMGRQTDSSVPKGLDWDFYLGPAPMVPFNPNRFLGNFRWYWDYAGGIITDWGTHRFDSMHQVMGVDTPTTVSAAGQRFELDDGGEVPDILQVTYEYPGFVVSYEACALNAHGCGGRTPGRTYYGANSTDDRPNGLAFYGTNGALFADRIGFEIYPELRPGTSLRRPPPDRVSANLFRMDRKEASTPDSTFQHVSNFIDCVRSRQQPAADIQIGHRASIVAHLGNIAYRTGRKIKWDGASEAIIGDAQASQLVGRTARKPWDLI
jgi:predicted dehydrogenase